MSDLAGYDLVYAVTQQAINHQFELLSVLSVLPGEWHVALNKVHPDAPPKIDAQLGIPTINLLTTDDTVEVTFPLTSGTLSYFKLNYAQLDDNGNPTSTAQHVALGGASLVLKMTMNLAKLASVDISQGKAIPAEVKKQLAELDESMLDISHLFLNFEDANLLETYQLNVPKGNSDLNAPEVIDQIKSLLDSLFKGLKQTNNPFILGYTITNKQAPPSNATFVPTGTNYSVYPDSAHPLRSSLNYLLVTGGKPVPTTASGTFSQNWINADDVEGTFVIAQEHVMDLILPNIINAFGGNIQVFQQQGIGIHLQRANSEGGVDTCDIQPVPGTNTINVGFKFTFNKNVYDLAGTNIGNMNGWGGWTTTILFNCDASNNIAISVTNTQFAQAVNRYENTLGQIEDTLASWADAISATFSGPKNYLEGFNSDAFRVTINSGAVPTFSSFKTRIILPAGNTLFYKDARFSAEGHLLLTTTYKD